MLPILATCVVVLLAVTAERLHAPRSAGGGVGLRTLAPAGPLGLGGSILAGPGTRRLMLGPDDFALYPFQDQ